MRECTKFVSLNYTKREFEDLSQVQITLYCNNFNA